MRWGQLAIDAAMNIIIAGLVCVVGVLVVSGVVALLARAPLTLVILGVFLASMMFYTYAGDPEYYKGASRK